MPPAAVSDDFSIMPQHAAAVRRQSIYYVIGEIYTLKQPWVRFNRPPHPCSCLVVEAGLVRALI